MHLSKPKTSDVLPSPNCVLVIVVKTFKSSQNIFIHNNNMHIKIASNTTTNAT